MAASTGPTDAAAPMTGAVERINAWIVGRLRSRREIRFLDDAIESQGRRYRLSELTQAVAVNEARFVGQRMALVLAFGAGRIVRLSEDEPCWGDLVAALDRSNLTALPSADWTMRLIGGAETVILLD